MDDVQRCRRCGAPEPGLRSATQAEGEVVGCPDPFHRPQVARWEAGTRVNPDVDVIVHDEPVTDRVVMRTVDVEGPDGLLG